MALPDAVGAPLAFSPGGARRTYHYHGVLAAHARWRTQAVSYEGSKTPLVAPRAVDSGARGVAEFQKEAAGKPCHWTWGDLMRRAFALPLTSSQPT